MEGKKRSLAALLEEAKEAHLEEDTLIVTLENGTSYARSTLDDAENRRLMAAAASEAFGRPLKVEYRFRSPAISPAAGRAGPLQTPALQPRQAAVPEPLTPPPDQEALRLHPLVQRAVELFGGQVVRVIEKQPGQGATGG